MIWFTLINAIIWIALFVLLYRTVSRQQSLSQQLDAIERAANQQTSTAE